jgi:hypothetical protein
LFVLAPKKKKRRSPKDALAKLFCGSKAGQGDTDVDDMPYYQRSESDDHRDTGYFVEVESRSRGTEKHQSFSHQDTTQVRAALEQQHFYDDVGDGDDRTMPYGGDERNSHTTVTDHAVLSHQTSSTQDKDDAAVDALFESGKKRNGSENNNDEKTGTRSNGTPGGNPAVQGVTRTSSNNSKVPRDPGGVCSTESHGSRGVGSTGPRTSQGPAASSTKATPSARLPSDNLLFYQGKLRCRPDNMLIDEIHRY